MCVNFNEKNKRTFPGEKNPMRRQWMIGAATLFTAAVLLIVGLMPSEANAPAIDPSADPVGNVPQALTETGCQILQELSYTPCEHHLTRRVELPQELVGKTRAEIEGAYDQWRVTEFLPKEVTMEQNMDIYCAQHMVLMPDESGILAVFENKYGDALAFIQSTEISLETLPDAIQEEVRPGKGFDDMTALEQWLESVES